MGRPKLPNREPVPPEVARVIEHQLRVGHVVRCAPCGAVYARVSSPAPRGSMASMLGAEFSVLAGAPFGTCPACYRPEIKGLKTPVKDMIDPSLDGISAAR